MRTYLWPQFLPRRFAQPLVSNAGPTVTNASIARHGDFFQFTKAAPWLKAI